MRGLAAAAVVAFATAAPAGAGNARPDDAKFAAVLIRIAIQREQKAVKAFLRGQNGEHQLQTAVQALTVVDKQAVGATVEGEIETAVRADTNAAHLSAQDSSVQAREKLALDIEGTLWLKERALAATEREAGEHVAPPLPGTRDVGAYTLVILVPPADVGGSLGLAPIAPPSFPAVGILAPEPAKCTSRWCRFVALVDEERGKADPKPPPLYLEVTEDGKPIRADVQFSGWHSGAAAAADEKLLKDSLDGHGSAVDDGHTFSWSISGTTTGSAAVEKDMYEQLSGVVSDIETFLDAELARLDAEESPPAGASPPTGHCTFSASSGSAATAADGGELIGNTATVTCTDALFDRIEATVAGHTAQPSSGQVQAPSFAAPASCPVAGPTVTCTIEIPGSVKPADGERAWAGWAYAPSDPFNAASPKSACSAVIDVTVSYHGAVVARDAHLTPTGCS